MTREALLAAAAACLGRPGAEGRAGRLLGACDTKELAGAARAQGLAAVALDAAESVGLPEEKLAPLREAARAEAARALALEPGLEEIAGAARDKGLEALLVKGLALDRGAYPRPGLRTASDLDLLVRPGELAGWAELLAALGYSRLPAVDRTWRRAEREVVDLHAKSSDLVGVIDVPEELSPVRLDLPGIFARARPVPGLPLAAPGVEDHLVISAAHGLGVHLFEKLVWLLDVAVLHWRAAQREFVAELALASGAARLVWRSLELAAAAALLDVPGELAHRLRPDRPGRVEAGLCARLARGQVLPDRAEFLLALFLPAPRGYRSAILRRALFPRRRALASHGAPAGPRGALSHLRKLAELARLALWPQKQS
jgi:hypothetical protein